MDRLSIMNGFPVQMGRCSRQKDHNHISLVSWKQTAHWSLQQECPFHWVLTITEILSDTFSNIKQCMKSNESDAIWDCMSAERQSTLYCCWSRACVLVWATELATLPPLTIQQIKNFCAFKNHRAVHLCVSLSPCWLWAWAFVAVSYQAMSHTVWENLRHYRSRSRILV